MAGYFIAFHRMLRLKDAMLATLTSPEFKALKLKNKKVKRAVAFLSNTEMWRAVFVLTRRLFPALRVLRLADSNTPAFDRLVYFIHRTDESLASEDDDMDNLTYFRSGAVPYADPDSSDSSDSDEDAEPDDEPPGFNEYSSLKKLLQDLWEVSSLALI